MRSLFKFLRRFSKRKKIQLAITGGILGIIIIVLVILKLFNIFAATTDINNTATIYYQDALGGNYSVNSNMVTTTLETPVPTPTPIITPSVLPTATPTAPSNTVRIFLTLQGRTNNSTTNSRLSIYAVGGTTPVFERSDINLDGTGQGQATVSNLTSGQSYDYRFKVTEHLSTFISNTIYQNNISLAFAAQKGGDLNNDNMVNTLDFAVLSGNWNTNNSIADINGDATVNTLDFSILSSNWFVRGQ